MRVKKYLAIILTLTMIICSALPSFATRSGGSGGGGGGSSSSSSGGGGGSSSSSSGGGGGSSSSGRSGGGGSSSSGSAALIIPSSSGASGGGGGNDPDWNPDDAMFKSGDPDYYDPLAWDSIVDFYEYQDSINNKGNVSNRSQSSSGGSTIIGPGVGERTSGGGNGVNGWYKGDNNKWYFYEPSSNTNESSRATGWKKIGGTWYCFGSDGTMYQNTVTPDGYIVDSNGAWMR